MLHSCTGNCVVEEAVSKSKRFRFDPRAIEDRKARSVSEMNLDELREATMCSAGILCYVPAQPDPYHQEPDLSDCAVALEIEVTEEERVEPVSLLLPPSLSDVAQSVGVDAEQFFEEVCKAVDTKTVDLVSDKTREQSASSVWFAYRKGRITGSKLFKVAKKVKQDGTVSEKNDSILKDIMGYRPPAYSPAIHWGHYNEDIAIKAFYKHMRSKHKKMEIQKCGVVLYGEIPIIAASPDALVTCSCHGVRPLEVKNPFTHRNLPIIEFANQPSTCLESTASGEIKLKSNHEYYYQVQAEMLVKHADAGYFCLRTASPINNLHVEEIPFDPMLMEETIEKAKVFFKSVVVPELLTGKLREEIDTGSTLCRTEDLLPGVTQQPVPSSSDNNYVCRVCCQTCVDEPAEFRERSVSCDCCQEWFHWVCVGLKGTEPFLSNQKLQWKCPFCKPSTSPSK